MARAPKVAARTQIDALQHRDTRVNIPTEELRDFVADDEREPKTLLYARDPSLDPQLVWKGKDEQDSEDLAVPAVPIYIQEKIQPRALIEDLRRDVGRGTRDAEQQLNLFGDFDGIEFEDLVDFYQHEQNWSNRMILGDSLLVMASLAEKEGLKGKVQTIYLDPPYGIKFGSNWQVSTRKRDVKDGRAEDMSRQPEQIKAFRDTWQLGIHSYLAYLRDRLVVARELLTESGSVFVQIGDENVHLVRCLLDEVFGSEHFVSEIMIQKTSGQDQEHLDNTNDYIVWYAKNLATVKYRQVLLEKSVGERGASLFHYSRFLNEYGVPVSLSEISASSVSDIPDPLRLFTLEDLSSRGSGGDAVFPFTWRKSNFLPASGRHWRTHIDGLLRLAKAGRIDQAGNLTRYVKFLGDFMLLSLNNMWTDVSTGGFGGRKKQYVVETNLKIIQRCILMTTDPGDLVLDPTCGSVDDGVCRGAVGAALDHDRHEPGGAGAGADAADGGALPVLPAGRFRREAREGARHQRRCGRDDAGGWWRHSQGVRLQAHATHHAQEHRQQPGNRRDSRALCRTARSAAGGDQRVAGVEWEEWQVPRSLDDAGASSANGREAQAERSFTAVQDDRGKGDLRLQQWWELRRERQREIDASIARRAETETLYDQPYEDNKRVRVSGPFTVESLSPHRVLATDDERPESEVEGQRAAESNGGGFVAMILENLKKAGVQNTVRQERLTFERLESYGGEWLQAEGEYTDVGGMTRRVAVAIGPEHGTVGPDTIKESAKEALRGAGFDMLVVCGFAFDAHAGETAREFSPSSNGKGHDGFIAEETRQYGKLPVLLARMNPDLAMGEALLKTTGAGNLFMVFGEPDIDIRAEPDSRLVVEVRGVDVYVPATCEIRSSSTDEIACWFIDTAYNAESFFVRHAYYTGSAEPYDKLKRALRAEIDEAAWSQLYSTTSRPFDTPTTGRIAVKVINHYGDEVLKVYEVS